MVKVNESVVARLKSGNKHFEMLVDCDSAMKLKHGQAVSMGDVLASDAIFSEARKGTKASHVDVKAVFGTDNPEDVAKQIIMKGEVQLTAEYRRKLMDEKKKQIIEMIRRDGIDPRTNIPHPAARIEAAMEEARVKIDEHKNAKEQVEGIVKALRPILPIKLAMQEIQVRLPAAHASKCFSMIKQFGGLKKEEWLGDGSLVTVSEIPAGLQEEFMSKINAATKGTADAKILKTI